MILFKDLEPGDSFLLLEDTKFFNMRQNRMVKLSTQPWLVRLPSSAGYSTHEAQFNAIAACAPNIGFNINPETQVLHLK